MLAYLTIMTYAWLRHHYSVMTRHILSIPFEVATLSNTCTQQDDVGWTPRLTHIVSELQEQHRMISDQPPRISAGMLASCCDAVAEVFVAPLRDPGQWVYYVTRMLHEIFDDPIAIQCAIVRSVGSHPGWETQHAAAYCPLQPTLESYLLFDARKGFATDDALIRMGHRKPNNIPVIGTRDTLIPDEHWVDSSMRDARSRLGLHRLALGILPLPDDSELRSIVLRIDGLTPNWIPEHHVVPALFALSKPLTQSYFDRFLSLESRREVLLAKLSPMQQQLVPMLARGMTEEAIGAVIKRSKHTVHDHAKHIYRAWGVNSRHELRQLWTNESTLTGTTYASK